MRGAWGASVGVRGRHLLGVPVRHNYCQPQTVQSLCTLILFYNVKMPDEKCNA